MVDPALMRWVFTRLVTNAVQAMPDGGRVTIRTSRDDGDAFIAVKNTGVGISDENLLNLFKPLFTTKAKGKGFRLAVCKRVIEAHGGTITVESEVGKGSTFTVKIPFRNKSSQGFFA
ncbi:MAG: ATP-binding protein [Candidatus Bathyarchaeota archaeon]|nr:ATP-binding protein [Candidatus Bathyarchaeota archaeon]